MIFDANLTSITPPPHTHTQSELDLRIKAFWIKWIKLFSTIRVLCTFCLIMVLTDIHYLLHSLWLTLTHILCIYSLTLLNLLYFGSLSDSFQIFPDTNVIERILLFPLYCSLKLQQNEFAKTKISLGNISFWFISVHFVFSQLS